MTPEIWPGATNTFCFGCGRHNPIGLHLVFERDGDDVLTSYQPRPEDQGFPGIMHGGLLSLLLDEAMGWAMYADEVFAVTARMETRFRRPVPLDGALTARARVARRRGRRIELEAALHDVEGQTLVEASGLFVRMPAEEEAEALATFRDRGQAAG
ncbi:MAG: PaaI family thioesterase [Dehalococcoidia bacterium]|jgi:acyl-coenzyme A thioesterase PaaI-like protein|nr:PaaI family thioesterase [Dehalococcoidia bacterium]